MNGSIIFEVNGAEAASIYGPANCDTPRLGDRVVVLVDGVLYQGEVRHVRWDGLYKNGQCCYLRPLVYVRSEKPKKAKP